ncbi:GGDEF domain-containing protein [Parazoarcus communis]|uniref:GGDEF domain-containing protein n=1 Tax=Parazoarcus communis TaxID=41977 RepID=A0A2U8GQ17_9RHOO|nr:EAL domain-containing protein [Parazoarcus communis]AWI75737.1 GGDEF domain-containing protein [Parazoarcus communis]
MMMPADVENRLMQEAAPLLMGLLSNELSGVYVIQGDRFIFVNQRLADLFGYTPEVLCAGMGPTQLIAPAYQPLAKREIDRRLSGEVKSSFFNFEGVRSDGSRLDVEVFGVATTFSGKPAIIGILLDVSERCKAERAVADQLRFIEQLVDTIPSPVFFKDESGRYLGCNAAFEDYLGQTRDQIIGRSVYDISPKDLADRYFAADEALFRQGGKQTYEASIAYADGTRHDVVFNKATFNNARGELGGLVGVMLDISERKRMEQAVWHEANYDALTGLPNRRLFHDRLREEVKRSQRGGGRFAQLFIDLDRFKEVNDTLGHDLGDKLLVEAAARISKSVRTSDTVSRLGGDEFVVIAPGIADKNAAGAIAQHIIEQMQMPFDLDGKLAYVSASIGIAFYPDDSTEMDTLLGYADQAMYAAKAQGRNGFCYFAQPMQVSAMQRLQTGNDLRSAVKAEQLVVHYQPIVDLSDNRIVKAEALVRWLHPVRGLLGPDEFIPVAEDIGVISEIGQWVFERAMQMASRWHALRGLKADADTAEAGIQISVNMSPRQFMSGSSAGWIEHLRQHGLPASALAVEITEGLLLDTRPVVIEALMAFRDAGVQVSIDDFGTGYSAMSYLKKFDIDYLKIDRSFVRDLTTDASDLAIAEAMIVMAHKLGMKVVAEGVETAAQRDLLRSAGCDYAQGYLFSRPLDEEAFARLLETSSLIATEAA